ncbi:hypothetical protein U9M48_034823 [Paspalum notatum var. saurae]|uniref:Uncharacterized protein n=1 Tax=Paspalum notatum var. saurae TaxID=547442 RepID=A0AAQ3X9C5_PASNO
MGDGERVCAHPSVPLSSIHALPRCCFRRRVSAVPEPRRLSPSPPFSVCHRSRSACNLLPQRGPTPSHPWSRVACCLLPQHSPTPPRLPEPRRLPPPPRRGPAPPRPRSPAATSPAWSRGVEPPDLEPLRPPPPRLTRPRGAEPPSPRLKAATSTGTNLPLQLGPTGALPRWAAYPHPHNEPLDERSRKWSTAMVAVAGMIELLPLLLDTVRLKICWALATGSPLTTMGVSSMVSVPTSTVAHYPVDFHW